MRKSTKPNAPRRKAQRTRKHPHKAKRGVAWNPEAVIHQGVAPTEVLRLQRSDAVSRRPSEAKRAWAGVCSGRRSFLDEGRVQFDSD